MSKGDKKYSKTVKDPKTGRKKTVRYGAKGYSIAQRPRLRVVKQGQYIRQPAEGFLEGPD